MKIQLTQLSVGMLAGAILSTLPTGFARAEWPQYRGAATDGVSTERVATAWPESGLRQLWRVDSGGGFSGIVASGGRAFTIVQRSVDGVRSEVCIALDAASGKEAWSRVVGVSKYDGGGDAGAPGNDGGDGPRSTPAVGPDGVYVLTGGLVLHCLNKTDGAVVWKRDLVKEHGARNITWQNAASPLLDGGRVYVCAGGAGQSLLAFNARSGATEWKLENDAMTHATPVVAEVCGQRQVIFFTQSGLVAVHPEAGKVLWRYKFPYRTSTASSPVVGGDIVYCSAGYGVGAGAVRVTRMGDTFAAAEIWRTPGQLMNHWSTPVVKDGFVYGLFGFKQYGKAPMKCIELSTGREIWSKEGFGQGGTILVGGHVLTLSDAGELTLVEATPKAYVETARFRAVPGKCWNSPAISNGRIFARSTKGVACFEVPSGRAAR